LPADLLGSWQTSILPWLTCREVAPTQSADVRWTACPKFCQTLWSLFNMESCPIGPQQPKPILMGQAIDEIDVQHMKMSSTLQLNVLLWILAYIA